MARASHPRKNQAEVVTVPAVTLDSGAGQFDDDGADLGSDTYNELALSRLLTELGESSQRANIIVYKVERQGGAKKDVRLFETTPAEFSWSEIQAEYGGGDYRVMVYRTYRDADDVRDRYGVSSNKMYSIAAPRKKDLPALGAAPQSGNDIAAAIAAAMRPVLETQAQLMTMISGGGAGGSRKAMLEEMQMMAGIIRPAGAAPVESDPLAQLSRLMKMSAEVRALGGDGGDGGGDPGMLAMNKAIELLANIFAQRAQQPTASVQSLPAPAPAVASGQADSAAGAGGSGSAGAQPEAADMNRIQNSIFRSYLEIANTAASTGAPVDTYADLVATHAPDDVLNTLEHDPEWFAALVKIHPGVSPYGAWYGQLRVKVLEYLAEEALDPDAKAA